MGFVSSPARFTIPCEGLASVGDNGSCRLRCVLARDLTNGRNESEWACLRTWGRDH